MFAGFGYASYSRSFIAGLVSALYPKLSTLKPEPETLNPGP
jgi:hypothetical protein